MANEYQEKLKDPRWQKKRLEIFSRDNWTCRRCQSTTKELHVHHKRYIAGRDPWEYADHYLETVCRNCHASEHEIETKAVRPVNTPARLEDFITGGKFNHLLTTEETSEADARHMQKLAAVAKRSKEISRAKSLGIY